MLHTPAIDTFFIHPYRGMPLPPVAFSGIIEMAEMAEMVEMERSLDKESKII
jgi:hypothetical protein